MQCSTPFGDIDGCTDALTPDEDTLYLCSTPFGDIDGCTPAYGPTLMDALDPMNKLSISA